MIYEIYMDENLLYFPDDSEYVVRNAVLKQQLNDSGTLSFDMPTVNPLYKKVFNRRSMIKVLKDNEEIFCGEVREAEELLDMYKSVTCVGELSFLFDSIQPQMVYHDITPCDFLGELLKVHNEQTEEKKHFQLGVVTVKDSNDSLYRYTNREDTLSCIRDKLCDKLNGYLRIRKVDNVRYLDLVTLDDYGKTCQQPVEFGSNLLEYAGKESGVDIVTAVIPLGARLEEQIVEGLDAYTTIESVNNGKDYVYSEEAVNQFGWVRKVVKWDDVTNPDNLKKKAEEWLKNNQYETLELELNAIDLSLLNVNLESFSVGDKIHAIAKPFGMDTYFPLQKKTTYLQDISKNYIVLGNTISKSYTEQIQQSNNSLKEEIPQEGDVLKKAKDNATALITGALGGFVVKKNDELLIMDTDDIETAKKVWRWNINGLGYSSTGYKGEYGLAITMDGQIVADFITAGKLSGSLIEAGTLEAETIRTAFNAISKYMQMANGELHIYDGDVTDDKLITKFNHTGNHFYKDGYYVGKIGVNHWSQNTEHKGLVFDLESQGKYMAFAQKETEESQEYTVMLAFARDETIYGSYGLHAGCDFNMHGHTLKNVSFEGGGISGTLKFKQITELNEDGTPASWVDASLTFQNGILVDGIWTNL